MAGPEIEKQRNHESALAEKVATLDATTTLALIYYVSAESAGEVQRGAWPVRGTVDAIIERFLDKPESEKLQRLTA